MEPEQHTKKIKGYTMPEMSYLDRENILYPNQTLIPQQDVRQSFNTLNNTPSNLGGSFNLRGGQSFNNGSNIVQQTNQPYVLSGQELGQMSQRDIINNPEAFANYDFSNAEPGQYGTNPITTGSNFDVGATINNIATGIGAISTGLGAYQNWEANKRNMEVDKRNERRLNKETERRDKQRKIIGSAFSSAAPSSVIQ